MIGMAGVAFVAAALVLGLHPAKAETISVEGERAVLLGEISKKVPDKVAALPEQVRVLVLTSVGGYTTSAFEAAKEIRARGLTTYVPEFCFSACTMLFQAGTRRVIGPRARLMYHASTASNPEYDYWVGRIYIRYGLDEEFVDRFSKAGGDHTLAPDQAVGVGAATMIGTP